MDRLVTVGSESACRVLDYVGSNLYPQYCDKYLLPDAYQTAGYVFWGCVVALGFTAVALVQRLVNWTFK